MKKNFFFLFFVISLFISSNALAVNYTLDLSNINGTDYGTYNDVWELQGAAFGTVNQYFGSTFGDSTTNDNMFNDGDEFTEYSMITELSYKSSPGQPVPSSLLNLNNTGMQLFLVAEDLKGYATDVQASNPADLKTYTFDYVFYAGIGDIGMYLDDDGSIDGSSIRIADFSLSKGDGSGEDGFLGTDDNTGSTRLTIDFLNTTLDGVFLADNGIDMGDLDILEYAYMKLTTTNTVTSPIDTYVVGEGLGGFTADIDSVVQQTVEAGVVPEPGSMMLLGFGLIAVAGVSRRKIFKN